MVGGYGHDDRVDAYPALMAEIETKVPAYTTVCVLTDKEEIGSDGVTGMQSMYAFHFMQELCRTAGQDDILGLPQQRLPVRRRHRCLRPVLGQRLRADERHLCRPWRGDLQVHRRRQQGRRQAMPAQSWSAMSPGCSTRATSAWQIGELGRLDLGGGGTIAKYVANRGIPVLDIGVPVLSMHSPFEVIHKSDLYMAYRAFSLFNNAQ